MYNRYIPGTNGTYERRTVPELVRQQEKACVRPVAEINICKQDSEEKGCCKKKMTTSGIDLGDILVLCIILLLLVDSDEEDMFPLLIAAVMFLFF